MKYRQYVFLLAIAWAIPRPAWSAEPEQGQGSDFIMHHIGDAHAWHFMTWGQTLITLPLPIIIFSRDQGLDCFLSHRFFDADHHPIPYQGYRLTAADTIQAVDPSRSFYDLSITKNVAALWISAGLLVGFVLWAQQRYQQASRQVPRGVWALFEWVVLFVRNEIAIPNIGSQQYVRFMPYLLTVFFFIWLNNVLGLLPAAANVTGNISVTLVLALFTFCTTHLHATRAYWKHVFCTPGVPKWLLPVMIPVECMGLLTKPVSLAFRLFANITAGHIILLSIISIIFIFRTAWMGLVSVPFGAFMLLLKFLIAFIQAYIFTLLSAIYVGTAVESHDSTAS